MGHLNLVLKYRFVQDSDSTTISQRWTQFDIILCHFILKKKGYFIRIIGLVSYSDRSDFCRTLHDNNVNIILSLCERAEGIPLQALHVITLTSHQSSRSFLVTNNSLIMLIRNIFLNKWRFWYVRIFGLFITAYKYKPAP